MAISYAIIIKRLESVQLSDVYKIHSLYTCDTRSTGPAIVRQSSIYLVGNI